MSQRITGLETEYGCLMQPPAQPQDVLPRIRDWLFENDRYGLIDLHDRDWDEPAGNGGFFFYGGGVFIYIGHLGDFTPGGASALGVGRYDRAGGLLLSEAVRALRLQDRGSVHPHNFDHY